MAYLQENLLLTWSFNSLTKNSKLPLSLQGVLLNVQVQTALWTCTAVKDLLLMTAVLRECHVGQSHVVLQYLQYQTPVCDWQSVQVSPKEPADLVQAVHFCKQIRSFGLVPPEEQGAFIKYCILVSTYILTVLILQKCNFKIVQRAVGTEEDARDKVVWTDPTLVFLHHHNNDIGTATPGYQDNIGPGSTLPLTTDVVWAFT